MVEDSIRKLDNWLKRNGGIGQEKKGMPRLKVLFLPYWYPSVDKPISGIFIREHAKAVSLYNEVVILYNESCDRNIEGLYKIISDRREDG